MRTEAQIERPADRPDELRVRKGTVRMLTIPEHRFVMIDGAGPPGPDTFGPRMPGLYGVAYQLRSALKRRGLVTKVGTLEGLWWHADGPIDLDALFADGARTGWRWTLMIALPDVATGDELDVPLEAGRAKTDPSVATSLRIERFEEGDAAQLLHVGNYAEERPSIERLHEAIAEARLRPRGRHHEIYLSDPSRTPPERLRTILRQPVERGAIDATDLGGR